MTLAPLSCPSYPILATSILGFLPSFFEKALIKLVISSISYLAASLDFSVYSLKAPFTTESLATCLPYTVSKASEISPRVALAAAAFTAKSKRFPLWS
jgi:hypothetical protein